MKNQETVPCPYRTCNKTWKVLSSFTCHLSRFHKKNDCISNNEQDFLFNENEILEVPLEYNLDDNNTTIEHQNTIDVKDRQNMFILNTAQFYLMLESKLLVPGSTIQCIVNEINKMHEEDQEIKAKMRNCLISKNVSESHINLLFPLVL